MSICASLTLPWGSWVYAEFTSTSIPNRLIVGKKIQGVFIPNGRIILLLISSDVSRKKLFSSYVAEWICVYVSV